MKAIARYKFDSCTTFDELRVAIRKIELELNQREPSKNTTPSSKDTTPNKEMKKLRQKLDQVTTQLDRQQQQEQKLYEEQHHTPRRYQRDLSNIRCYRCDQYGHFAINCEVRLDHSKRGQIYQRVVTTKDAFGISRKQLNTMTSRHRDSNLVGDATETPVYINGIKTHGLLDTGSTVSTMSEYFYKKHLHQTEIQPLDHFLDIECADGRQLPYLGYVSADLDVDGIPTQSTTVVFLVVPTSQYHSSVPILLGTNVLSVLMDAQDSVWTILSTDSLTTYSMALSL